MNPLASEYEILGVSPDVSDHELQRAYRAMVKQWHPDQFHDDPIMREEADRHMREINAAYQKITEARELDEVELEEEEDVEEEENQEAAPPARKTPTAAIVLFVLALFGSLVLLLNPGSDEDTEGSEETLSAAAQPAGETLSSPGEGTNRTPPEPEPNRPVIIRKIGWMADDFVVDVWHNGVRVNDDQRRLANERYGACGEDVTLNLREGDWLVFNVVNNRMRWGGAAFFGAFGWSEEETLRFVSKAEDHRWSYEDDPSKVPEFIASFNKQGNPIQRTTNTWNEGHRLLGGRTKGLWNGDSIWGDPKSRNLWIKFKVVGITFPGADEMVTEPESQ